MNRRELVTALGCVAATPFVAAAQQPERMRRIGVFIPSADNQEGQARLQAFVARLQQFGWTEGRNVLIDIRSVGGSAERSREVAAEFVALAPDVILSSGSVSTAVLKRATTSMPVVFVMVNEPVAQGLVPSLSRPAGNITGFTFIDFSVLGKTVE